MRFYRPRGYGYRDVRFEEDLQILRNRAVYGIHEDYEALFKIPRSETLSYIALAKIVKANPSDRNAKEALKLWNQAQSLSDKAADLCKKAEEILKRN